jgi:putative transposase
VTRFRFIAEEAAQFPVSLLCRVMGVTRAGFYAWKRRPPSARALADAELSERIGRIHDEVLGIYGAPRIHAELRLAHGIRVGKKRVARLMAERGIFGAGRRGGPATTSRDPARPSAPDLVDREFARAKPNRLWVCDIKYVGTGQGFLFLAVVQDVFSRRIVGWSMRDDLRAELVLDALGMAVAQRRVGDGLVAHSDHGSQYTSLAYGTYARPRASSCRWARSAIPGTTRSPRPSSPASRRSSFAASALRPARPPGCGCSGTSSASTTPAAATPGSAT